MLSGSRDHTLKLWDIKTGSFIKTIPLQWIPLEIKFQPGHPGLFATANGNGTVTFFDIREFLEGILSLVLLVPFFWEVELLNHFI